MCNHFIVTVETELCCFYGSSCFGYYTQTLKHFLRVSLLYIGHNKFGINVAYMISFLSTYFIYKCMAINVNSKV